MFKIRTRCILRCDDTFIEHHGEQILLLKVWFLDAVVIVKRPVPHTYNPCTVTQKGGCDRRIPADSASTFQDGANERNAQHFKSYTLDQVTFESLVNDTC